MKKVVKVKAWAVVCGEKLLVVRATKSSAAGHWADLSNSFDKVYEVIPCTISYSIPKRKKVK